MKYFSLTLLWTTTFISAFLFASATSVQVDPADDFSFSLGHPVDTEAYRLISEQQVTQIFSEKLDHFPKSLAQRLSNHVLSLCKRYRLDPAFILSLIEVESGYHVRAVSPVGAIGLMQVMLPTARFVVDTLGFHFSGFETFSGVSLRGRVLTTSILSDPFVNTAIGIAYLSYLRDHYVGFSPYHVLAAYNLGPSRLDQLMTQKSFRPVGTKKYFQAICGGIPSFRYYRSKEAKSPI